MVQVAIISLKPLHPLYKYCSCVSACVHVQLLKLNHFTLNDSSITILFGPTLAKLKFSN